MQVFAGKSGVYIGAMTGLIKRLCVACLLAGSARAEGLAGEFDYYVLSLSWSPSYCALEGETRGDAQCDLGRDFAFTLHGLWPQYEAGWPSDCHTSHRDPARAETAAMAEIMGSGGLAWHEWQKHGRCSGLSSQAYFETARRAFGTFQIPGELQSLRRDILIPPELLERALLETNPGLTADMLTVTCKGERLLDVRICLTRTLEPRECAADVVADCGLGKVLLEKVR